MNQFIEKHGLNAATLKWLAIIFMVLNHLCYSLYKFVGIDNYFLSDVHWYLTRFGFVIFAFQISEGMHYTHDKLKYILYLFVFALISQVPYNLCFYGSAICFDGMCVLWTLGIAATVIAVIAHYNKDPLITCVVTVLGVAIGYIMNAEYSFIGIPMMVLMYYFRDVKWKQLTFSAIAFVVGTILEFMFGNIRYGITLAETFNDESFWHVVFEEWHGLVAWILIFFYNGKKGKNINKWFFYGFYPGHIILIYLLSLVLINVLA